MTTLFLWVYGWVGVAMVSAFALPDLALARPVRDDPRHRREGRTGGRRSRAGTTADYPAWLGRWPAIIGLVFFVWLELVGAVSGPRIAVHRPRRLHRVHAGDDGPVRPRRLAPRRRDVQRLVRAAQPARAVRARSRRPNTRPPPTVRVGAAARRLDDARHRDHRRSAPGRSCSTGYPRRRPGSASSARRTCRSRRSSCSGSWG